MKCSERELETCVARCNAQWSLKCSLGEIKTTAHTRTCVVMNWVVRHDDRDSLKIGCKTQLYKDIQRWLTKTGSEMFSTTRSHKQSMSNVRVLNSCANQTHPPQTKLKRGRLHETVASGWDTYNQSPEFGTN
jgi:hypothetical protein